MKTKANVKAKIVSEILSKRFECIGKIDAVKYVLSIDKSMPLGAIVRGYEIAYKTETN